MTVCVKDKTVFTVANITTIQEYADGVMFIIAVALLIIYRDIQLIYFAVLPLQIVGMIGLHEFFGHGGCWSEKACEYHMLATRLIVYGTLANTIILEVALVVTNGGINYSDTLTCLMVISVTINAILFLVGAIPDGTLLFEEE